MTDDVYGRFYALLEQRTGISLDRTKQYLVESRLAEMARRSIHGTVPEFLRALLMQTAVGEPHLRAFEAMATHETMFFRDRPIFDALASSVLPDLIRKRDKERTLRICCAAVSTGQEVYSLAMMLKERFPQLAGWKVHFQATDLSYAALERARLGIYNRTEIERGLDPYLITKYFTPVAGDKFQALPVLRDAVAFHCANLLGPLPEMPKFDLILLRNVLIYFGQETKDKVLRRIHAQLIPRDGILILGAAESILENPLFRMQSLGRLTCYSTT
jgi:chemotaxis protein methyltransferase CheR